MNIAAIIIAVLTLGYMLPWAIAVCRNSQNAVAIFWINLLLGWTGAGWLAVLIWSFL